ncbi:MAG: SPOR domain-containing protein [Chitinispirillaceae bacterium]|nr:SPOR domain-containing protein [Chitinispirillaceae bacterium]
MKNTKILIVIGVAFIIVATIGGCEKKKSSQDTEFLSSSEVTNKPTKPSPSTTQDIFDEFYKEESSSSQAQREVSRTKKKEISSTPPTPYSSSEKPSFSENGKYVIQIASVPSFSLAEKISKKLKEKGYPTYIAEVINPTPSLSGTYYRVRIGGFKGMTEAKEFGEKFLAPEGYEYWIDKRSNDSRGVEIQYTPPSGAYYNPESQPKADYLYYTPSSYTPPASSETNTNATTTTVPTNTNPDAGATESKSSSSSGEKSKGEAQPQPQQPQSGQTEWKDEW